MVTIIGSWYRITTENVNRRHSLKEQASSVEMPEGIVGGGEGGRDGGGRGGSNRIGSSSGKQLGK